MSTTFIVAEPRACLLALADVTGTGAWLLVTKAVDLLGENCQLTDGISLIVAPR